MQTVPPTPNRTILSRSLQIAVSSCLSMALLACGTPDASQSTANSAPHSESELTAMNHDTMDHSVIEHDAMSDGMDDAMIANNSENMAHENMNHNDMNSHEPAPALGQDYSIYQVGGEWTDSNGNSFKLNQLKGKNQVVVMAYTSCQHTCPILVRGMKQIDKTLTPDAKKATEFVLVTLDTKRDTPSVMKNYAEHNQLGDNWRLIRSDAATTRMLANTLNIKYQFADNGDINHSNLISILDKQGRLVAQEVGVADSGIHPLIEYLNTHS